MSLRSLPSAPLKRKASDYISELYSPMVSKRQRIPGYTEYSDIRAVIITWADHDLDDDSLTEEIEQVTNFFENFLGVIKCVQVRIPPYSRNPGDFVRGEIQDFKDSAAETGILNLVYYAGHGGQGLDGRTLTAASGNGQSFDWNSLQWDCIFSGDNDTVVFLDCCFAGASFRCSFKGCKDVFGACSATSTTAGPGENSFSDLFVRAGLSQNREGFTLENWVDETAELAYENGCVRPVSRSFGDSRYQICFKPREWMARKRLQEAKEARETARRVARRREMERRANRKLLIETILTAVWDLQDLDYDYWPYSDEINQIESDPGLIEPFTQLGVYRAFRRVEDGKIEAGLSGTPDEDSEDDASECTYMRYDETVATSLFLKRETPYQPVNPWTGEKKLVWQQMTEADVRTVVQFSPACDSLYRNADGRFWKGLL